LGLLEKPENDILSHLNKTRLSALAEKASTLGAERFIQQIHYLLEILKQDPPKPEHAHLLESELKLLEGALERHLNPVPTPEAPARPC
jgi:hypothetical protein